MSVRKRIWTNRQGEQKEAWIVDYVDRDGDRHIQTFERKKDADEYHATVKVEVRKGTHTAPAKSIKVKEGCTRWIKSAEAEGLERSTLDHYGTHIKYHIVPHLGQNKLANLTPATMEHFRDKLLAEISRPLARKVLVSLKSMLKVNGYSHVAAGITIKQSNRDKRKLEVGRDIPTPAEVKRIVAAATDTRTRALILLAALTGLRASELRGLRWSDIDLKKPALHVRQRADKYAAIGAPKSATSARTVSVDEAILLPALKAWKLACPKFESDLVFPAKNGLPKHHRIMSYSVFAAMKEAGVVNKAGEPKYTMHSFRHFFASWCINRRADGGRELPPKTVQTLLGHSSITMTLDVYSHLFPAADDRIELAESARALLA